MSQAGETFNSLRRLLNVRGRTGPTARVEFALSLLCRCQRTNVTWGSFWRDIENGPIGDTLKRMPPIAYLETMRPTG